MSNTSKNEQMNTTLKRADLDIIRQALEWWTTPPLEITEEFRKSIHDMDAKPTLEKIKGMLNSLNVENLTLGDIAKLLDIHQLKSINIDGLDYYYGDGMIGAFVPNSNNMLRSWKENEVSEFLEAHAIYSMDDLKEYTR